jgi:hypothetical protein
MEIDSLPTTHAGHDTARLDGVLSMDDFVSSYGAQSAANKAAKSTPGPKLGAGPIALGARSSKHTQDLHNKYQKLGIQQPVFTYQGSSDSGWCGEVSFPGLQDELQGIKDETMYPSKQQAKEEISGHALAILERLEKEGTVKKVKAHSARVSKHTVALHDKCQKLGVPQPFFTYDGSTESGWCAQVGFPGMAEIQDVRDDKYHASKGEAKEAVSGQVLEVIEKAEREGMFDKFDKAKGPAHQAPKEKEEPGPNYVGQLLGIHIPHLPVTHN